MHANVFKDLEVFMTLSSQITRMLRFKWGHQQISTATSYFAISPWSIRQFMDASIRIPTCRNSLVFFPLFSPCNMFRRQPLAFHTVMVVIKQISSDFAFLVPLQLTFPTQLSGSTYQDRDNTYFRSAFFIHTLMSTFFHLPLLFWVSWEC